MMLTNLPSRPRSRNSTVPGTVAKRVSSLPSPTFLPGLYRVPRCRTMIDPPVTNSPENTLIPNRCELESRPFLELPKPFLCAMQKSFGPLGQNFLNRHARIVLPMADGAFVLLLSFELEDDDFVAPAVSGDFSAHPRRFHRLAEKQFVGFVRHRENAVELHRRTDVSYERVHINRLPRHHAILLTARFNHSVHNF